MIEECMHTRARSVGDMLVAANGASAVHAEQELPFFVFLSLFYIIYI